MLIQIELQPDTAALVNNATARGISLDRVLRSALEDAETGSSVSRNGSSGAADSVSPQEIDEQLDVLAGGSGDNAPVLPREADSRAFYYEERI